MRAREPRLCAASGLAVEDPHVDRPAHESCAGCFLDADTIDLAALKAAKIVARRVKRAKIIAAGNLEKAVVVKGIAVTPGARKAIEAAGGKVEDA